MTYKPTIGLEIHTELKTNSKMFCSCANNPFAQEPNINICPVCMGHPGTLPVINKRALELVIKTGLALNCKIAQQSQFERKNYFYPDLPKGYQISQYAIPLCREGYLRLSDKKSGITRIHLEEDTAKLMHQKGDSLIDFNRAGVPLMELVTEPDFFSAEEAHSFAKELQLILRYLAVSDADMEKGQMRVEANISLQPKSQTSKQSKLATGQANSNNQNSKSKLGTKVELKNLNSFKAVKEGIEYEIKRQTEVLEAGEKVVQETRGWDSKKRVTVIQREKEEAHDYRYFPEPDLPPLTYTEEDIKKIQGEVPELPAQKRERFYLEYGLKKEDVETFVQNKDLGEYFEQVMSELREWVKTKEGKDALSEEKHRELAQATSNYITSDLLGLLEGLSVKSERFLITAENFAELVAMAYFKEITSRSAKNLLKEMFETGADPSELIKSKGIDKTIEDAELEAIIQNVITNNQKAAKDYKQGKTNALQYLIGQVMAQTQGRAKPESAEQALTKFLQEANI